MCSNLLLDDIRYCAPIHHQPLRHLQSNGLDAIPADMVDGLVYLKVVVPWKRLWISAMCMCTSLYQRSPAIAALRSGSFKISSGIWLATRRIGTAFALGLLVPTKRLRGFDGPATGTGGVSMPPEAFISAGEDIIIIKKSTCHLILWTFLGGQTGRTDIIT